MNTFSEGDQVRVTEQAIKARKGTKRYANLFSNVIYTIEYSSGFDVYVLEGIGGYFNNDELILVKKKESKLKLKPFDLEAAKAGKPVCTRDGRKARILCFDLQSIEKTPIVAAVQVTDKQEVISHYYEDGRQFVDGISELDLMMLSEKKEGWVNVYKTSLYKTEDKAKEHIAPGLNYLRTVKVEWEE